MVRSLRTICLVSLIIMGVYFLTLSSESRKLDLVLEAVFSKTKFWKSKYFYIILSASIANTTDREEFLIVRTSHKIALYTESCDRNKNDKSYINIS